MRAVAVVACAIAAAAQPKVSVNFYGEALCPGCRATATGPIKELLAAEGLPAIIDFDYVPFGNAVFVTDACGDNIFCWTGRCSVADPPADCFTGAVSCQHGVQECYGNVVEACAKNLTRGDPLRYMPFVDCYEGAGNVSEANMRRCASQHRVDATAVEQCASGAEGKALVGLEARKTVVIPGRTTEAYVPMVQVNGVIMKDPSKVIATVCAAYTGVKPAGCRS